MGGEKKVRYLCDPKFGFPCTSRDKRTRECSLSVTVICERRMTEREFEEAKRHIKNNG